MLAFDLPLERRALAEGLCTLGFHAAQAGNPEDGPISAEHADAIAACAAAGRPVGFVVCDARTSPAAAAKVLAAARARSTDGSVRGLLIVDPVTRPSLEQFRAAGFTSYLVRPIRPQTLAERFGTAQADRVAEDERVLQTLEAGELSCTPHGRHVLLAEDNAVNALLATRMLEKSGCTVEHAADGEQAVAAVVKSLEEGARRFDLILMDVHMPRLDGLAATAKIRALVGAEQRALVPPIVALTANAFSEDRDRCLAAGLDDYLAKPFHKSDLIGLLARWDRRRREGEGRAA